MSESSLPTSWKYLEFEQCLKSERGVRASAVQQSDYQKAGKIPVIDQGQKSIAGYVDNDESLYRGQLPVVIFGDHTRIFKYVDFPFAVGADGTKILTPNDKVNGKFFYFTLSRLDIPNRGYNRHYKVLKEKFIPLPPLPEQRSITAVLSKIQEAIAAQQEIIVRTRELKKALMAKLFTEGLRGEPTKETEIGRVPESWEVFRLEQITTIERGKFSHRPRNDPKFYGGDVPFIQTGDVTRSGGRISQFSQTLNELGLSVSRIFPKGTILITIAANIGDTGILQFDSAFPDSIIGLTPFSEMDSEYLEYYLRTQKDTMDMLAPRGTQKNINIEFLKPWPVPTPSIAEQKEIAHVLNMLSEKEQNAFQKKSNIDDLFKTMLHELMTGNIRTTGIM